MAPNILTLSVMTREIIHLVRGVMGHGMLYDARFHSDVSPFSDRARELGLMGVGVHQFNVGWEVDTSKLLLSLADFSETILLPRANGLADRICKSRGLISFDLPLPSRGVIEACRYMCDGVAIRGIIAHNIGTDGEIARWDIQFGACGYEALNRMGHAA